MVGGRTLRSDPLLPQRPMISREDAPPIMRPSSVASTVHSVYCQNREGRQLRSCRTWRPSKEHKLEHPGVEASEQTASRGCSCGALQAGRTMIGGQAASKLQGSIPSATRRPAAASGTAIRQQEALDNRVASGRIPPFLAPSTSALVRFEFRRGSPSRIRGFKASARLPTGGERPPVHEWLTAERLAYDG